jgi:hypothetical protein
LFIMRAKSDTTAALMLAASLLLAACHEGPDAEPTDPSQPAVTVAAAAHAPAGSPRERAVLAAMEQYKQAILDRDTAELARIWTENYTFINPQGVLVTREERLANLGSGNTNVQIIDNEREITVRPARSRRIRNDRPAVARRTPLGRSADRPQSSRGCWGSADRMSASPTGANG